MLSSLDIFILSRINELSSRLRLKASDAEASLQFDSKTGESVLKFDGIPSAPDARQSFERLMNILGCENYALRTKDTWVMENILSAALKRTPKNRER